MENRKCDVLCMSNNHNLPGRLVSKRAGLVCSMTFYVLNSLRSGLGS